MPITVCTLDGDPGFKWGSGGKCYTYEAGDEDARSRARARAEARGGAARASGYARRAGTPLATSKGEEKLVAGIAGIRQIFEKAEDDIEPKAALKLLHELETEAADSVDDAWQATMGRAVKQFGSRSYTTATQVSDATRRLEGIAKNFGRSPKLAEAVKATVEGAYGFGLLFVWSRYVEIEARGKLKQTEPLVIRTEKAKPSGQTITGSINFTLVDQKAISETYDASMNVWLTDKAGNKYTDGRIRAKLNTRAKELIQRGESASVVGDRLRQEAEALYGVGTFASRGRTYWGGVVEHIATESGIRGQLVEMQRLGFTRYEITNPMDERTSEICTALNGKTLLVSDAQSMVQRVNSAGSVEEVKAAKPFASGGRVKPVEAALGAKLPPGDKTLTPAQSKSLGEAGFATPPYHFRCRSMVDVVYDETEILQPPVVPTPPSKRPKGGTLPASAGKIKIVDTPIGPMRVNASGETPFTAKYPAGTTKLRPDGRFNEKKFLNATKKYDPMEARRRQGYQAPSFRKRGKPTASELEIRKQLNNLLAEYRVISSDLLFEDENAGRFIIASLEKNYLGVHGWRGRLELREDGWQSLQGFVSGKRGAENLEAMKAMVHESLHGASGIASGAYRGAGAVIEEVATEISARLITWEKWSSAAGEHHTWGAYQNYMTKTVDAIDAVVKKHSAKTISTGMETWGSGARSFTKRTIEGKTVPSFADPKTIAGQVTEASMNMKRMSRRNVRDRAVRLHKPDDLIKEFVANYPAPPDIAGKPRKVSAFKRDLMRALKNLEP